LQFLRSRAFSYLVFARRLFLVEPTGKPLMHSKKIAAATMVLSLLGGFPVASHALDSVSLELAGGNRTWIARLAAQWDWQRQWWRSNGSHLGGYWDVNVSQWHGRRFQDRDGNVQNITAIGITPMFRLQRDNRLGPYIEAGIGAHLLSKEYDNNGRRLAGHFQFGERLGVGYVFASRLAVGVSIQHFSNGGLKEPNSGVNLAAINFAYGF
jgi:lipid A 3-O-deacylase